MNAKKMQSLYGEVLWSGKKRILGMPISFTRYILTSTKLITRIGFLNIKEDEIEIYRIVDRKISFPFFERIFGCGTIVFVSRDVDTPEKVIKCIKNPREAKRIMEEAIELQRQQYRVRGRDMIGGEDYGHEQMEYDSDNSII